MTEIYKISPPTQISKIYNFEKDYLRISTTTRRTDDKSTIFQKMKQSSGSNIGEIKSEFGDLNFYSQVEEQNRDGLDRHIEQLNYPSSGFAGNYNHANKNKSKSQLKFVKINYLPLPKIQQVDIIDNTETHINLNPEPKQPQNLKKRYPSKYLKNQKSNFVTREILNGNANINTVTNASNPLECSNLILNLSSGNSRYKDRRKHAKNNNSNQRRQQKQKTFSGQTRNSVAFDLDDYTCNEINVSYENTTLVSNLKRKNKSSGRHHRKKQQQQTFSASTPIASHKIHHKIQDTFKNSWNLADNLNSHDAIYDTVRGFRTVNHRKKQQNFHSNKNPTIYSNTLPVKARVKTEHSNKPIYADSSANSLRKNTKTILAKHTVKSKQEGREKKRENEHTTKLTGNQQHIYTSLSKSNNRKIKKKLNFKLEAVDDFKHEFTTNEYTNNKTFIKSGSLELEFDDQDKSRERDRRSSSAHKNLTVNASKINTKYHKSSTKTLKLKDDIDTASTYTNLTEGSYFRNELLKRTKNCKTGVYSGEINFNIKEGYKSGAVDARTSSRKTYSTFESNDTAVRYVEVRFSTDTCSNEALNQGYWCFGV